MPTYEYTCRDCGHTFDIVQSMWDDALTMCPECGGSLRKVFAPPAISFKGSGFYATDHGKKAKPSDGEKGEKGEKGGKAETKGTSDKDKKDGGSDGSASKTSSPTTKKEAAAS
jgi:putative FmdB family regulatory protein